MARRNATTPGHMIGQYVLDEEIAAGGMATVHVGRFLGAAGFARTVAIKRLHEHMAKDRDFVAMLLDEARVASRVPHPNVVAVLDVVVAEDEVLLVMEYVHGDSLSGLSRAVREQKGEISLPIAAAIVTDLLKGLHAAHEAKTESGGPLEIVHRDVSPQNVIVGADGHARVGDFGIAHAQGRLQTTRDGVIKGKIAYIAPEQFTRGAITRRVDIYGAAIVFWQLITGEALFTGEHDAAIIEQILFGSPRSARDIVPSLSPELDAVLARGLARDPASRFETARAMALAIEQATKIASVTEVSAWVERYAKETLAARARIVARLEAAAPLAIESRPASARAAPVEVSPERERTAETAPLEPAHAAGESTVATAVMPGAPRNVPDRSSGRRRRVVVGLGGIAFVILVAGTWGAWARSRRASTSLVTPSASRAPVMDPSSESSWGSTPTTPKGAPSALSYASATEPSFEAPATVASTPPSTPLSAGPPPHSTRTARPPVRPPRPLPKGLPDRPN